MFWLKLYHLNPNPWFRICRGEYRGNRTFIPPLRFQNSFLIALRGKKTCAKQEKYLSFLFFLFLNLDFCSEINLLPPSLKSCIRPCVFVCVSEPVLSIIMFKQWSCCSRTLGDDSLAARCLS